MESAARSYFSKKYLGYYSPEKHGGIVAVRLFEPISWTRHGRSQKLSLGTGLSIYETCGVIDHVTHQSELKVI
jgi:hypothetical protein